MAEDSNGKIRPEDVLRSLAAAPKDDPRAALDAQVAKAKPSTAGEADVAAALDAKAFRPKVGKEDALQAMANGQWKDQEPLPLAGDSEDDQDSQAEIVDEDSQAAPGPLPRVSGARRMQMVRSSSGIKKFLVPPLLVTGLLLWILGGAVAFLSASGRLGESSSIRTIMVISAFPMGAFLMLGAWLFHQESRK